MGLATRKQMKKLNLSCPNGREHGTLVRVLGRPATGLYPYWVLIGPF